MQPRKLSNGRRGEKPTPPRLLFGGEMLQPALNNQQRSPARSAAAAAAKSSVPPLLGDSSEQHSEKGNVTDDSWKYLKCRLKDNSPEIPA